jgi:hypothetical protein
VDKAELLIQPREDTAFVLDGKIYGLFAHREDAELEWVATVLRRALQVPAEAAPPTPAPELALAAAPQE